VRAVLPEEVTSLLLTVAHKAYSTEINDLLITAVARGWCAWTGKSICALTLEGHGREPFDRDIDLSRTIGWFTSIYPVTIELTPAGDIRRAITSVKDTLRRIPHKGAGYGILRYIAGEEQTVVALPSLAFNYLGRFDSDAWFERAPEDPPPTSAPDLPVPWPLEVTAAVVEGRLEYALTYSLKRFDRAAAQSFLDHFRRELEHVVHHTMSRAETELTASDIDYAGLTEQGLDDFLGTL
jgi:fengycin family lipopeptide synthetase B